MVGIVDYGAGNLRSVQKALEAIGERALISGEAAVLDGCERLILPGVGSFGAGMAELDKALPALFTPASAVSFLLFTLLYTPCVAAIATVRRELRSRFATLGVVAAQCAIAWCVAFLAYRIAQCF